MTASQLLTASLILLLLELVLFGVVAHRILKVLRDINTTWDRVLAQLGTPLRADETKRTSEDAEMIRFRLREKLREVKVPWETEESTSDDQ